MTKKPKLVASINADPVSLVVVCLSTRHVPSEYLRNTKLLTSMEVARVARNHAEATIYGSKQCRV